MERNKDLVNSTTPVDAPLTVDSTMVRVEDLLSPGLQTVLTSDVLLDLLKIPSGGLIRIRAALFFLGDEDMFAFYWRGAQDGRQNCKLLSADAVRASFSPTPFDSGWLPPGTLRFGTDAAGTRWVSMSIPPSLHRLTIIDNDLGILNLTIPLPGFVFTGRGRSYWIWAVKDTQVTAQTELYHAPLSNVSTNGSICFGSNQPPEVAGATILQAFYLFLDSPFNGHMANNKSHKHRGDIRYLLQELATGEAASFPTEDLFAITVRESSTKALTLDQLLTALMRQRR